MNYRLNNKKPDIEMEDGVVLYDKNRDNVMSSNKINVFGKRNDNSLNISGYNPEFIKGLRRQFDSSFLSKIVDIYNTMSSKKPSLKDIDNIVEFMMDYNELLKKKYIYCLLFPESSKAIRIPTKFPLPSATFKQRTFFTVSPNSAGNWFLQWTPQTLLSSAYVTANSGDLLLNNSTNITGSSVDSTAANYTPVTVTRLLASGLVQAYRLVSASLIVSYQGSIDSHSGMIGGGVDVSYYDSTIPDTSASQFSVIDDKIWRNRGQPYDGLRLIYFPKDYSDLNFIRPDVSTQNNGLATCMRFLVYGQNLPSGSSCKIELVRNFEIIPLPGMADFVNMDHLKTHELPSYKGGEPALEAGSKIAEKQLVVTSALDRSKLEMLANNEDNDFDFSDIDEATETAKERPTGGIADIALYLGKNLLQTGVSLATGAIPFVGGAIGAGINTGIDMLSNKIKNLYN